MRPFGDLTGRTALITGASEGIGRGLALGLAEAGADIIACSRRLALLDSVCQEARSMGRRAEAHCLDVTDFASIEETRVFCEEQFGTVDILVNSAGSSITKEAWSITPADWDLMLDVGLRGAFFCCQEFGSIMKRAGYGKIINISSTVARSVMAGTAVYAALKAGLSHLTEALAVEWAADGIRVNALAPTTTPTPSRMASQTPERTEALVARIPLGRQGSIQDIVPAAIFLASPASDFMTGQTMFVDGGWTAMG